MTNANDALAEAIAAERAAIQRREEIEAQRAAAQVAETGSQPSEPQYSGPGPKELAIQIHGRAIADGAREEDATALVIAAYARRAQAGDKRFLSSSPKRVRIDPFDYQE